MFKKFIFSEEKESAIIERSKEIIKNFHALKKQSDEIRNRYKELKNRPSTYEKN